ncbi:hypothetical protein L3C95_25320 [Chitinophaga filiformis]|uniref:hypothetical protein n=1 Tax=Chitinophaga filiformis TaxID=104663 RepID=UPI001F16891D|nr:hypothetical protein [Chitinophaga filiformis]MCF6406240.1 hypothetical protein [Chitinophaga filiformis]
MKNWALKKENLMALAQYHVNENSNKTKITRKILEEFAEITEPAESHKKKGKLLQVV